MKEETAYKLWKFLISGYIKTFAYFVSFLLIFILPPLNLYGIVNGEVQIVGSEHFWVFDRPEYPTDVDLSRLVYELLALWISWSVFEYFRPTIGNWMIQRYGIVYEAEERKNLNLSK